MSIEKRKKAGTKRSRVHPSHNQQITLSVIGAGRLGTALAISLARCGYRVEAVVARRLNHARRAARLVPGHPQALSVTQLDSLPLSDLLLITTPDDAIEQAAACLAASIINTGRKGQRRMALHCSGALSSGILSSLSDVNFHVGAMHPLVSISDPLHGAERLRGAYYCVEGDPAAVRMARKVVRELKGHSFSINSNDKALYHAAAVMASGHMVALFDIALEMLALCGLKEKEAQAVLLPLVQSILENIRERDPAHALTGTFARADTATMRSHLAALRSSEKTNDALEAYRLLGRRSLQLAERNGIDAEALKEIKSALEEVDQY
ncbi:MAG: DUF2520 domain-containing protein [Acidobacteria bacterium]|nr:DUF2520 domain-containing protein [Acidobacteriota bacterium]